MLKEEEPNIEDLILLLEKRTKTFGSECPICLGSFKNGEHLTVYECCHLIHTTCLEEKLNL